MPAKTNQHYAEALDWGRLRGREISAYLAGLSGGVDPGQVAGLCERLELDLGRRWAEYSRGNKKKLALVLAFLHRPELLILDEPTGGLDSAVGGRPAALFADYLRLGTAQIRRSGAKEPAVARSLIQLFKDVGSSAVSEDRRRACARHIWLVLEDAKRETAQPADLETVQADGACRAGRAGSRPPPTSRRLSREAASNPPGWRETSRPQQGSGWKAGDPSGLPSRGGSRRKAAR